MNWATVRVLSLTAWRYRKEIAWLVKAACAKFSEIKENVKKDLEGK